MLATKERIIAQRQFATERYILSTLPLLYLPLYRLDSGSSGGTFTSGDGHGYICTDTGTLINQLGRTFDGVDDLITIPQTASINNLVTITIIAWIHPTGWGENTAGRIVEKSPKSFQTDGTSSQNVLYFEHLFSTSGAGWKTANGTISLNTWQMVGVTYDNSDTTNDAVLYINGVSKAVTETAAPVGTASLDAANDLIIGNNVATTRSYKGIEGEVLYYSRILSAPEIMNYHLATEWRYR